MKIWSLNSEQAATKGSCSLRSESVWVQILLTSCHLEGEAYMLHPVSSSHQRWCNIEPPLWTSADVQRLNDYRLHGAIRLTWSASNKKRNWHVAAGNWSICWHYVHPTEDHPRTNTMYGVYHLITCLFSILRTECNIKFLLCHHWLGCGQICNTVATFQPTEVWGYSLKLQNLNTVCKSERLKRHLSRRRTDGFMAVGGKREK